MNDKLTELMDTLVFARGERTFNEEETILYLKMCKMFATWSEGQEKIMRKEINGMDNETDDDDFSLVVS